MQKTPIANTSSSPDLRKKFMEVRLATDELLSRVSPEDACVQSMTDASPVKWHAAHTTWFFETFVLKHYEVNFRPYDKAYDTLFNSYYNSIGDQFARRCRGLITRPSLATVREYRNNVNERIYEVINGRHDSELRRLIELGINHEQQHQELVVMDIKHLLSINPTNPILCEEKLIDPLKKPFRWIDFEGGLFEFGHQSDSFHFDNEGPVHKRFLEDYRLSSHLVTNREFLAFITDGGYDDPLLWLSDGWAWVKTEGSCQPLYWRNHEGIWFEFTLSGLIPLILDNPVCHINFYEAAAYATWAKARIPSEFEWEHASYNYKDNGESVGFHAIRESKCRDLNDLYGSVWQWTNSSYSPYPKYYPSRDAIGEYNGKFMSNQNVLKGSACCTPKNHSRHTYRNFFYPHQRWAFSGLRLAKDSD